MKKKTKRHPLKILLLSLLAFLLILCLALQIGYTVSDNNVTIWKPGYEKADLTDVLNKETLTEADYTLLYRQTGLTKTGVDRALSRGTKGKERIRAIQNFFFGTQTVKKTPFAPWMCTDYLEDLVAGIYLEDGDILVTGSTHLSGMRVGHAGLVIDGERGDILQATAYGSLSRIGDIENFTNRINFMVLRVKADPETRARVVNYAKENLVGLTYNALLGTASGGEGQKETQCAHLVWYAYHACGYELIDGDRMFVLPYDLANSDCVELVQVFGFDPDRLWDRLFF